MKTPLLLFFSLLVIGLKAQNGFTTYTANLATGVGSKITTSFLIDNNGDKWFGISNFFATNASLIKQTTATGVYTVFSNTTTPAIPTNKVFALAKDASNNIWIGTNIGLLKFDGTSFTVFNKTNGLPSDTVNCIDVLGSQIYIGTAVGLSRFDGNAFTNYNTTNALLPFNNINCVKAQTANKIWLGGVGQLVELTISNSFISSYNINTLPLINYQSSSTNSINCIYFDAQNLMWIGATTDALLFNGTSFTNVKDYYAIVGATLPVYDFANGPHNGVIYCYNYNDSNSQVGNALLEIEPNGNLHTYVTTFPSGSNLGRLLENYNNQIFGSGFVNASPVIPKTYYEFNYLNNILPFGVVTNDNFKYLDINQVKAGISNRSDMHTEMDGSGSASYIVPKNQKDASSNYASALWIGGLDDANNLHVAAQTYRQGGVDFWPGPLNTNDATIDSATSKAFDKIWKVNYTDINTFITNYNNGSVQNGSYIIPPNIATWPGNGTGLQDPMLAPFVDSNNDGFYDPMQGDYPKIKGDQTLYFIYNDATTHQQTQGLPLGVEVHAMAYAYGCPTVLNGKDELNYTTFYDYKIINRSVNNYHNVFVNMFSDADLGGAYDNFIGCNIHDNYGYVFNGDDFDENDNGVHGYLSYPPAQGIAILKGASAILDDGLDNNNNGLVDELNEDCKLNNFIYYDNIQNASNGGPSISNEFYNLMSGFWTDGTLLTCGGNGLGGTTQTNWAYCGDPNSNTSSDPNNTCGNWIETSFPDHRRMIVGSGPFNLSAGQIQEVEYAFVTSFDSSSTINPHLLSVAKLKTDVQKVRNFYELVNKPTCLNTLQGINEVVTQSNFSVYPNPTTGLLNITSQLLTHNNVISYQVVDVIGKTIINNKTTNTNFTVDLSSLTPGVYFVKLSINNLSIVKKIIKQ